MDTPAEPTLYIPSNSAGYLLTTCSHHTWIGARDNLIALFGTFGQVYDWSDLEDMGYSIKTFKLVEI
jgi:hypothetical protein